MVHYDCINCIDSTQHRFHALCHRYTEWKKGSGETYTLPIHECSLFYFSPPPPLSPFLDSSKINATFSSTYLKDKANERKGKVKYTFLRVRV